MSKEDVATCVKYVYRSDALGRGKPCGKPAKGEWKDKPMCGIHLAAEKKKADNDAIAAQRNKADRQAEFESMRAVRALALCGVEAIAQPHISGYRYMGAPEAGVWLSAEAVGKLIDERLS